MSLQLSQTVKSLLLVMLSLSFFATHHVYAASGGSSSKSSKSSKYKTRKAASMRQPVFKKLHAVQQQIDAKDYEGAQKALEDLRNKTKRLSAYEKAQAWNLTAYVFYLQEQYSKAINAYNQVLQQGDLPEALIQSTLKTMGQLYFVTEQYDLALKTVKELLGKVESPAVEVYMLLGQAHFQLKEYKKALPPIKKAVNMYRKQGRKPKEQWLQLLRVIYHYEDDYEKMRQVLEEMVSLYPKETHLRALAGVYSELGNTEKQLTIMEILYERDYKQTSSQIINLANLYLLHGIPYKAAKLLQQELEVKKRVDAKEQNYRLLSQAWYQAREDEKSIPPLRRAAEMSKNGELYIRMAQAYQNLDRWEEAVEALQTGIKKGGLKRTDTAQLMLGMALFNQHKLKLAKKHFELAQQDKRSAKVASQWIAYVKNELHRQTILDAATFKSHANDG